MRKYYSAAPYHKAVIPITPNTDIESLINVGRWLVSDGEILLVGLVGIGTEDSLSKGTIIARELRSKLHSFLYEDGLMTRQRVRVSYEPWEEFFDVLMEEHPDLLIMEWQVQFGDLFVLPDEVLLRAPCDVVLSRGPLSNQVKKILVGLRGSPYAESALRLAISIARENQAKITALHIQPPGNEDDLLFEGLSKVLENITDIERVNLRNTDPAETLIDFSKVYDLAILGTSAQVQARMDLIGEISNKVLKGSPAGVLVVKSIRPEGLTPDAIGRSAISILVDKWFAENTYHAEEYSDFDYLIDLKQRQNLKISLALPALNEEDTVGNVITTIRNSLMDTNPLLDEIVLMDSNSSDRTREIAESLDVPVYIHQQVLSKYGARDGKGEALWKSLYVTSGDIIVWIDTDIVNIHPRFVYGLLGPLLENPKIQFVKGFYRRPLKIGEKIQAGGGGRVTELTARPLINLFFPELSGVVQPLSGEYGGRRAALDKLIFYSGYGVETGLMIDVYEKFGLSSIAQVDLQERIHHNQPLESLSKMSFAIIQVVMRKLEKRYSQNFMEEVNKSMKLIRYEPSRLFLEIDEIAERERPPMVEIEEYIERNIN